MGVMGTKPIHALTPEEKNKAPKISDYFIDTGRNADEVKKLINVGDVITRERSLIEMGDCINSKSIDNRISVYLLIEALKSIQNTKLDYDIYGVFTVQEEVGVRGAISSALGINPDFGIALDVTVAYDLPGANGQEKVTRLNEGAAIKLMDSGTICDYRMVDFMKKIAQNNDIKYQMEILPAGGTDTAALQRYNVGGAIAGAISIPTRYLHQVIEMVHKSDVENAQQLLIGCLKEIKNHDWSFGL